ncbi:MAG: hypothetical protein M3680_31005 [Myxococcota bacterium]|nr:hypothetical protein [Myxococcota bacterium]
MASTLVETFELLVHAEQLAPRLAAAATALAQLPALEAEKAWLAAAVARLAAAQVESHGKLLDRALRLPELESVKGERGKLLQAAIADEVERLQAAITLVGGARSPLIEVLFLNLKVPALRKSGRAELERFCAELERRFTSSYARRMLKGEPYIAVMPTVKALGAAIATWRDVFVEPPLDDEAAAPLRDELATAGATVELAVRQARLLAQAALLPAAELLDAAGVVIAKARRRGKDVDEDTHPLLEQDPPDPLLPTAEERAEIAAVHATS